MIAIEHDCEEQGFSQIEDGCLRTECQTWEPGATKPTHPKLVKRERHGRLWWTCPSCNGSYGDAGQSTE